MIKRNITETVYEYDKEGKLLKKTVIETNEEEENTISTNSFPWTYLNGTPLTSNYYTTTSCDKIEQSDGINILEQLNAMTNNNCGSNCGTCGKCK